jgi:hypothetical protein
MVVEATISQVVSELQVMAASGCDDVVMVSAERIVPPPPPSRDHEAIESSATETSVPAAESVGGRATGASTSGALFAVNIGVIDLDATELPSNDRDIFEAVPECMLVY